MNTIVRAGWFLVIFFGVAFASTAYLVKQPNESIPQKLQKASVIVRCEPYMGSGFRVNSKIPLFWTVYHVIDTDPNHVFVVINGVDYPAKVVAGDKNKDLALLLVPNAPNGPGLEWETKHPELGESVWFCGSSVGKLNSITNGVISYFDRDPWHDQTSCPTFPGASGGIITTTNGRVIGLVTSGYGETFTEYIPERHIREWANSVGIKWAIE